MGFLEVVVYSILRLAYMAALLGVAIFCGLAWGAGTQSPLQGAGLADLIILVGLIWGQNSLMAERLAGRP